MDGHKSEYEKKKKIKKEKDEDDVDDEKCFEIQQNSHQENGIMIRELCPVMQINDAFCTLLLSEENKMKKKKKFIDR